MLQRRNMPFVMPAIKRPSIKKALTAFSNGDIGAVSKHTMTSQDNKISEDVTLVITRKSSLTVENQKLMDLCDKQTKGVHSVYHKHGIPTDR